MDEIVRQNSPLKISGCGTGCGCEPSRREVLKILGATSLGLLTSGLPAMAGPFERADFKDLVPEDKKLSEKWLRSLYERGAPTVYRGEELKFIGMPISGITTGQLYLAGDGRLWHWDVFNRPRPTDDTHYAHPLAVESSVEQGFTLRTTIGGTAQERSLDAAGFADVSFCGEYPIGLVEYRDPACPVSVSLEAFSPFVPLNVDDSSLPATVMRFTLKNTAKDRIDVELSGFLGNAVGHYSGQENGAVRFNRVTRDGNTLMVECAARQPDDHEKPLAGPAITFEDFEGADWGKWTAEGAAFGSGPTRGPTSAAQKLHGFQGQSLANSFQDGSDRPQGKLTSPEFTVERRYINFLIGGGKSAQTVINLRVSGNVVRSKSGKNSDTMEWAGWNVADLVGQTARIEIVDSASGGWGHIEVDQIEFADVPRYALPEFDRTFDVGTMGLALLEATDADIAEASASSTQSSAGHPRGSVSRKISLEPGQAHVATFVVCWCFPNLVLDGVKDGVGRHYGTRFQTAHAVALYVAAHFDHLATQTRLLHDTWYDSTLPHWFLERTFLNASILATSTAYRFANGRFYGWEGVGCCPGTCTHVWQYEQALGRLFPALDQLLRERVDFNPAVAFQADGMIDHRGEFHAGQAVDGQAGTILRAYRDHQMSANDAFLKRNWPSIKQAMQWLISQDANGDGILEGAQHNTLDAKWFGPVAWLSGMYLASLHASRAMALELADKDFAQQCQTILDVGTKKFVDLLFDGEYFINRPEAQHRDAINSGSGCEIDQVLGQSWAWQLGLGRVLPEHETRSALQSLWKYNFTPDAGHYRQLNKAGRWYAMAGEAGLLMCTFPRTDWDYEKAKGKGPDGFAGYFNECMNGFEHQVAGHMIWEGLVQEGLAIERSIHDRYHAARRNPWNEVECGDHYARSMASYGVFLAACGYEYHGPQGRLAFAPRLRPEDFSAAFTVAEGWGRFRQQRNDTAMQVTVELLSGRLRLCTLALKPLPGIDAGKVAASLNGTPLEVAHDVEHGTATLRFKSEVLINAGQTLNVVFG